MIKAIIFDVDGVLIDSVQIIVKFYQRTAKKLGLRIPTPKELMNLFGKPLEEIVTILWPDANHELYIQGYKILLMDKNLVFPKINGAVEAVNKIKEAGFGLGIVSGKGIRTIKKHLEDVGFDIKLFEVIASFEVTKNHKPNPDQIFYVIEKLNVKPEETLYVGDAILDYECAKNANVEYVAVLTGCLNREEQKKLGVKNIINSVSDLPEFLGLK